MRKILKIGAVANDGTGDKLRNAFDLTQQNFVELYSFFGDGENITSLSVRRKLNTPTHEEVDQKIIDAIGGGGTDDYLAKANNLSDVENKEQARKNIGVPSIEDLAIVEDLAIELNGLSESFSTHIDNKDNPHDVTKAQVGLDEVDNTSDLRKPISIAVQAALDLKPEKTEVLTKANNLSDVDSKEIVRNNLDVYSKEEVEALIGDDGEIVGISGGGTGATTKEQARENLDVPSIGYVTTALEVLQTPNATEAVAGKAKIATTAIAQAGVDDTDIITALKLAKTVFGIDQTTKVGSYVAGTIYTNTTPKLIFISVTGTPNQQNATTSIRINVNGVLFSAGGSYGVDGSRPFGCMAPIPRGSTWSYYVISASNIVVSELS